MPANTTNPSPRQLMVQTELTTTSVRSPGTPNDGTVSQTKSSETTNPPTASFPEATATPDSSMSMFDLQLVQFLQRLIGWTYLVLLLLLLAYLSVRLWLWLRERRACAADQAATGRPA